MTTKDYILLFTFSALLLSCSSTKTVNTYQSDQQITVNGAFSGWPAEQSTLQRDDNFNFHVMQDTNYLYIFIDFRSPFYNSAVRRSGFTVYMSPDEKNKKRRGIGYPVGSFNLLRESPGTFREMTSNNDWMQNPQNRRMLEELEKDNFEQIMIVENYDRSNEPQHGFVTLDQINAQGVEVAAATDSRYYSIEYRIPLDGSPPFELQKGKTYWLGFAIEPPEFRFRDNSDMSVTQRGYNRDRYRNQPRTTQGDQNQRLRRQAGQFEDWFKVRIN